MSKEGFVYFIQPESGGPIKIGFTKDLPSRMSQLRTGAADPLIVLGVVHGTIEDERMLHAELAEYRRHGEWFAPAPSVCARVKKLFGVTAKPDLAQGSGPLPPVKRCADCGEPSLPGENYCEQCTRCVVCGCVMYEGEVFICDDCIEQNAVELGLCIVCGKTREDTEEEYCFRCLAEHVLSIDEEESDVETAYV